MKVQLLQTKQTKAGFWARALRQGIPAAIGFVLGALVVFFLTGKRDWVFLTELVAAQLLLTPVTGAVRVLLHDNCNGKGKAENR